MNTVSQFSFKESKLDGPWLQFGIEDVIQKYHIKTYNIGYAFKMRNELSGRGCANLKFNTVSGDLEMNVRTMSEYDNGLYEIHMINQKVRVFYCNRVNVLNSLFEIFGPTGARVEMGQYGPRLDSDI